MSEIKEISIEEFNDVFSERIRNPDVITRLLEITNGELPFEDGYIPQDPFMPLSPYLAYPGEGISYVRGWAFFNGGVNVEAQTYEMDSYVNSNPEKTDTSRPRLVWGNGQVTRFKIANLLTNPVTIGSIPTIYEGISLAEFYKRLWSITMGRNLNMDQPRVKVRDMSEFYLALTNAKEPGSQKPNATAYYTGLMALQQVFGVGVNTGGNEDSRFYQAVVRPSILNASDILGVEPVAVTIPENLPQGKSAREIDVSWLSGVEDLELSLGLQRKEDYR